VGRLSFCSILAIVGVRDRAVQAASGKEKAVKRNYVMAPSAPARQSTDEAAAKSVGCISCHTSSGHRSMHENPGVVLGCTDCHGGDASVMSPGGGPTASDHTSGHDDHKEKAAGELSPYAKARDKAHC
jgi:hypothetical protein